jgi:hypothetical protein
MIIGGRIGFCNAHDFRYPKVRKQAPSVAAHRHRLLMRVNLGNLFRFIGLCGGICTSPPDFAETLNKENRSFRVVHPVQAEHACNPLGY